jgi:hypothetical protein
MSPYLFLLCGEGLSALLNHYNNGYIDRGMRVCNRSPWITHLLFADDSLIFINACGASAARLNGILTIYNQASGQQVNRNKSSIYFSPNTSDTLREEVKQELQILTEAFVRSIWVSLLRLGGLPMRPSSISPTVPRVI